MISYNKSKFILKKSIIKIGEEFINTNQCLNRITSKNIFVNSYYPSGNNAAFDGYAIKSSDTHKLNKMIHKKFKIIGSVAGAYLGSKVGDGMVGNLTTVLGGTVGFLIGGKIADILDSEEQSDLNNAINQTLTKNPDNVSNKWKSQKNIDTNAEIIPLNSYKIDQNSCRDFTKIVKKGEKQVQEKSTACRDEKGNWKII